MRVRLFTPPWGHPWIEGFRKVCEARGHKFSAEKGLANAYLHGWATEAVTPVTGAVNIVFMRRYELFSRAWLKIAWKQVDHLVCVNDWIAGIVRAKFAEMGVTTPVSVIYNAVDPARWTYRTRQANKMVGMACHVHPKKNLPLALQILQHLPGYELHIAGAVQDPCTLEYLNTIGQQMKVRIYTYGHIKDLDLWWDQMGYCLNTSISEGNPNSANEAMYKGIMPVIHRWPGAEQQYPEECLFTTIWEAAKIMQRDSGQYDSPRYHAWASDRFGMRNLETIIDLCEAYNETRSPRLLTTI